MKSSILAPTDRSLRPVALLTERRYTATEAAPHDWYLRNILEEDRRLAEALASEGLQAIRVDWADPEVDWSDFQVGVFRTTWDYFERMDEFRLWLDRVTPELPLLNRPDLVHWNLDKHYLLDLAERGIPVVPSLVLEAGDSRSLGSLLGETGWAEAVVKPTISATAHLTYRVNEASAPELEARLAPERARQDFLFQPFVPDIATGGELALMVLDGEVTHAVRKVPKPGDFRVQDDHGGTVHLHTPTSEEIQLATAAVQACGGDPLYARVDLVRMPHGGLAIMELELIEPELWLRTCPEAAPQLARGIARRL